jgi:hypothetical protein
MTLSLYRGGADRGGGQMDAQVLKILIFKCLGGVDRGYPRGGVTR